ncbi:hypothetical protein IRJ34_17235 [Paenarthrobacter sp. GOM3]|uniref:hypothetical protein n=1 Tax=Paenarthrobacter sp. GOM3 TaxID=2782567 RepID=UPI001BAAE074|nr:hypothetical protein [Paenarthrobacter sp. GOM3]WOH18077.1 hypothetical protein IRJ34_17235 [Paenarthrobacter sp. GOM3]
MTSEPLSLEPSISSADAPYTLELLGLDSDVLMNAVVRGVREAQNITNFHPVTARGFVQWSETVAALRAQLSEHNWRQADPQNSPRVVSPDGQTSIMVIGGNANTAVSEDVTPGTARRRGPSTAEAVQCNGQQMLDLIFELPALRQTRKPLIWVLLYHWSKDEPVVRAELSLPAEILDGNITQWTHRIFLPPADLSDLVISRRPAGPQDDVDFRIEELP